MSTPKKSSLGVEAVIKAAEAHGSDAGDPMMWVGDLEQALRCAWELLTPASKRKFMANMSDVIADWYDLDICADCGQPTPPPGPHDCREATLRAVKATLAQAQKALAENGDES